MRILEGEATADVPALSDKQVGLGMRLVQSAIADADQSMETGEDSSVAKPRFDLRAWRARGEADPKAMRAAEHKTVSAGNRRVLR